MDGLKECEGEEILKAGQNISSYLKSLQSLRNVVAVVQREVRRPHGHLECSKSLSLQSGDTEYYRNITEYYRNITEILQKYYRNITQKYYRNIVQCPKIHNNHPLSAY